MNVTETLSKPPTAAERGDRKPAAASAVPNLGPLVDLRNAMLGLLIAIVICFSAAALGGIVTGPAIGGWYQTLVKPAWQPPNWLFGPVWTVLFAMMAVSAWLIWKQMGLQAAAVPLTLFAIQLALNVAWSWIFFGFHRPDLAFLEILLLWLAIAATMVAFFDRSQLAGWLLIPYLAWVTFAAVLNFTIWRLNTA